MMFHFTNSHKLYWRRSFDWRSRLRTYSGAPGTL